MKPDQVVLVAPALFDGEALHDVGPQAVWVTDGKIASYGSAQEVMATAPAAKIYEFKTGTISPGLIDSHVHVTLPGDGSDYRGTLRLTPEERHFMAASNLRTHLECGVTTVRDLGSHLDFLSWKPEEPTLLPRIYRAGPPITPLDGHMHFFGGAYGSLAEALEKVAVNIAHGADVIKVASSGGGTRGNIPHKTMVDREIMERIVDVAHASGIPVTSHALSTRSIKEAVDCNVDGIEHIGFLGQDGISSFEREIAILSRDKNVYFGSTLGINERQIRMTGVDHRTRQEQRIRSAYYAHNAAELLDAGGFVAVASDAGWKHTYFGDFWHELSLLTNLGLDPHEVLHFATARNAKYLGIDHQVGSIRAGLDADLVVFGGSVRERIEGAKAVHAVFRRGRRAYYAPFA